MEELMSKIPSMGIRVSDLDAALATAVRVRELETALSKIVTILVNSSDCRSVLIIARAALAKGGPDAR
jgi:hypothetical protein